MFYLCFIINNLKLRKMKVLTLLEINLQQGLLIHDGTVIAAYSNKNKRVVFKAPYGTSYINRNGLSIPSPIEDYDLEDGLTDSFAIEMYVASGGYETV